MTRKDGFLSEERWCKTCKKTWMANFPTGFVFGSYETDDCPNCIPEYLMNAKPPDTEEENG
ncbi:hypothetical protein KAR91_39610 [Candidatus Pacearchaeota archaeon]|nr:hypothetical protein [Candidatus Pacearchaeota archaeon]